MTEDQSAKLQALRSLSRQDYLHALLLPAEMRDDFIILRRFHHTLRDIVARSSEAAIAQIQLKWWEEGIEGSRGGELRAHPLGADLLEYLDRQPHARAVLAAKADAHGDELYAEPPPDSTQFEGHAGATRSVLAQLLVSNDKGVPASAEISGHYGVAECVVETLTAADLLRSKGIVFIPEDILTLTKSSAADWLEDDDAFARSAAAFAEFGLEHTSAARTALHGSASKRSRVHAALGLYGHVLEQVRLKPSETPRGPDAVGAIRRQWLLWLG